MTTRMIAATSAVLAVTCLQSQIVNLRAPLDQYPNLTFSRSATATVRCLRGADPSVDVSSPTAPLWVDRGDGNGGGICSSDNYTASSLNTPPTTAGQAPAIVSGVNPGPVTIRATDASVIVQQGDLDVEGEVIIDWKDNSVNAQVNYDFINGNNSIEGSTYLRYVWTINGFVLHVRGVDITLTPTPSGNGGNGVSQIWFQNDKFRFRVWYRHSIGTCGIAIMQNGVWANLATGVTTGGPLLPFDSFYYGSSQGTSNFILGRFAEIIIHSIGDIPEFPVYMAFMGDSTFAAYNGPQIFGQILHINQRSNSGLFGYALAQPGDTTQGQLAKYNASFLKHSTTVKLFVIGIGFNNVGNPVLPSTWVTTLYQPLIATIRADHPAAIIVVCTMTPGRGFWEANYPTHPEYYTDWLEMNADIMGTGPNPVTGVDGRTDQHTTDTTTGAGYLLPPTPDGGHPGDPDRIIIGTDIGDYLRGIGALPP